MRRVLGSFTTTTTHPEVTTTGDKTKTKKKKKKKKREDKDNRQEEKRAAPGDWLGTNYYQISHSPDRPRDSEGGGRRGGVGGGGHRNNGSGSGAAEEQQQLISNLTDDECERRLVQLWQRNIWERERERDRGRRDMYAPAPTHGLMQGGQRGGGRAAAAVDEGETSTTPAPAPAPAHRKGNRPGDGDEDEDGGDNSSTRVEGPPLVLRTRDGSNGSGSSVTTNYCYPLYSPRSNRRERGAAFVPPPPPPSNHHHHHHHHHHNNNNDDNNSNNDTMMTINVYRSPSLAVHARGREGGGSERGRGDDGIGLGISVRETLDRDKPTPSTPQNYARGEAGVERPRDYFTLGHNGNGTGDNDNNNNINTGDEESRTKPRRKMMGGAAAATTISTAKENHHHSHRHRAPTGARKSRVVHRRRQTRYVKAASSSTTTTTRGGNRRRSPTSTYYDSIDIHGPLSTPGLLANLAGGGSGGGDRGIGHDGAPGLLDHNGASSSSFPAEPPQGRRCPMPGCTSNKPALPSSGGLCEDCESDYRPRESTFGPVIPRGKGGQSVVAPTVADTPVAAVAAVAVADKVASKFSARFNGPKLDPSFKLQPPPGGRKAAKHDSTRSTGSDRSHVGFQIAAATPRTPSPERRRRRYSNGQAEDECPDLGSATTTTTSKGTWESCYSLEGRDHEDPPSSRHTRQDKQGGGSAGTTTTYGDIAAVYNEFEDDGAKKEHHEHGAFYDPFFEIIAMYQDGGDKPGQEGDDKLDEMGDRHWKGGAISSASRTVGEIRETSKTFEDGRTRNTPPPRQGTPKRGKAAKKPRDALGGGLRGSDANVRSRKDHRDGVGRPEAHPQWNWI